MSINRQLLEQLKRDSVQKLNSLIGTLKTNLTEEQKKKIHYKIKQLEMKIDQIEETIGNT